MSFPFYHTYVENPYAAEDTFGARTRNPGPWEYVATLRGQPRPAPAGTSAGWSDPQDFLSRLPRLSWPARPEYEAAWNKTWELAARNLRRATAANGFASDFLSTAFNSSTFMWDSAFIALFGRYAGKAWPLQATCDNFYAKQHPDGFICREITEATGEDRFQRHDPSSTGPNVLPWAEWEYWLNTGDKDRLARVFPPLAAYCQWLRRYKTWPDGTYWTSGWGSGMDNQPRFEGAFPNHPPHRWQGVHELYDHGHGSWIDATLQALLAAKILVAMAEVLGRTAEVTDFQQEIEHLTGLINEKFWDEGTGFYHDLDRHGNRRNGVKTIGAYWALLAGVVPSHRLERFLAPLENLAQFNRTHRIPSLSADSEGYDPHGGYWKGGVWPPTNYMVLRGLEKIGRSALARDIALNHLDHVAKALQKTGTLWENYSPDDDGSAGAGHSTPDFVGWTGLVPTAVLLEFVLGLKPEAPKNRLVWDLRTLDAVTVERYPFGAGSSVNLSCQARASVYDEPKVVITADTELTVQLLWAGGGKILTIPKDTSC